MFKGATTLIFHRIQYIYTTIHSCTCYILHYLFYVYSLITYIVHIIHSMQCIHTKNHRHRNWGLKGAMTPDFTNSP